MNICRYTYSYFSESFRKLDFLEFLVFLFSFYEHLLDVFQNMLRYGIRFHLIGMLGELKFPNIFDTNSQNKLFKLSAKPCCQIV